MICVVVDAPKWNAFACSHGSGISVWVGSLLWHEANKLLYELMRFNGGANLVLELQEPSSFDHNLCQNGVSTASRPMRALRILMPLGMMIDIMEQANMSLFTNSGGAVECEVSDLRCPDRQLWHLNRGRPTEIVLRGVCSMEHCKTVEFPLNYEQATIRYSFSTPPKRGMLVQEWLKLCEQYVKLWMELLIAENRRQMQAT